MRNEIYNAEILLNGCIDAKNEKEWKKLAEAFYEVGNDIFFEIKNIITTRIVENEMEYDRNIYIGKSGFNEYKVNVMVFAFLHSIELMLKAIHIKLNIEYNNKSHNLVSLSNDINKKHGNEIIKQELINKIEIISKYDSREFCYLENKHYELLFKDEWVHLERFKENIDDITKALFKYI